MCDWLDIQAAIDSLPYEMKLVVQMLHEGYSERDAARRLGVSPSRAHDLKVQALAELRKRLASDEV
jgi:DNA-directed RNA polymerase specialized sigma24 family protein